LRVYELGSSPLINIDRSFRTRRYIELPRNFHTVSALNIKRPAKMRLPPCFAAIHCKL